MSSLFKYSPRAVFYRNHPSILQIGWFIFFYLKETVRADLITLNFTIFKFFKLSDGWRI